MPVNIKSLHGRLLNISREKKIDFQLLLNRLGGEQFLYRLSQSPYADKFIFKGGSLLAYLVDSDRKTKDLDFSVRQIGHEVSNVVEIVKSILSISVDDGIEWGKVQGDLLTHPEMEYPGVRIAIAFRVGQMRGTVRLDTAMGDVSHPVKRQLSRLSYKGQPFFGEAFSVLVYPPESVFAEKLQIIQKKRGQNTRMKDYYDLSTLIDYGLDSQILQETIRETFFNRKLPFASQIEFVPTELLMLQTYWEHFLKRDKIAKAPKEIGSVIQKINVFLEKLYGDKT